MITTAGPRGATHLDVQRMRSFVLVAQESNITRAAARLHLTQQAVSLHVQQLERELGVQLMTRQATGVALTAAGQELAACGVDLLASLDQVRHRVAAVARRTQTRSMHLAAGLAATPAVARAVERFATSTGTEVELLAVTSQTMGVELLTSRQADAALMWLPIGDPRLRHAVVRSDPRSVALPSAHPLADQGSLMVADIARDPVVMPEVFASAAALGDWLIDPRPDGSRVLRGPVAAGVLEALMSVARGRGIWIAPSPVRDWAQVPGVVWLPLADARPAKAAVLWLSDTPVDVIAGLIDALRKENLGAGRRNGGSGCSGEGSDGGPGGEGSDGAPGR